MKPENSANWWQKAVFYQIYPRSFCDGNGDGIGDFLGMISKLDYLQELGIDAIWLSPHYPSPNIDCGYDITDYRNVAPEYGDMNLFKQFLDGAHERGIRLVLDLVLNHTSDQHPWFTESRSSKKNPKRDWYVWKKGQNGNPPTNWFSAFGGHAWEYDPQTEEYYYHYFFKEQPDLNWRNPEVQAAMFGEARFWLDMGVDGFRLDAVGTIFEDESYPPLSLEIDQEGLYKLERIARNETDRKQVNRYWAEMYAHQENQPEVHQVMKDLRKVIDEYDDRVLIGETEDIRFYGNGSDELHLNFNFPLMKTRVLSAAHVRENQRMRLSQLPAEAWPCNTLGNHDSPRIHSAFGDGIHNEIQTRLYLMLLLTLKGTPFLYNGEELGMSNLGIDDARQFCDPLSTRYYYLEKTVMESNEKRAVLEGAKRGRDGNRTPMQWANAVNGGFCPANIKPWLPVNLNYSRGVNAEDQQADSNSMLAFYRNMLQIRRKYSALQTGEYCEIPTANENILMYKRSLENQEICVILNLGEHKQDLLWNTAEMYQMLLNNTNEGIDSESAILILQPYQGLIFLRA